MGIRAACSALTLLQVLFEITDALVTGFRILAVAARIGTQLPAPILRRKFLCPDGTASFNAVKATKKDNKIYLTMNTTKDALKAAPAFKYDRDKTVWVPDTNPK
jgi:hypothetical protein